MENNNRFVSISYSLYIDEDGEKRLVEKTTDDKPFELITGFGIALDSFEQQVTPLEKGAKFDFSLTKDDAYGDYRDDLLMELGRDVFSINGHFDHEHVYQDAVIQMQNDEGNRFYGRVVEVGEEKVKIDLNHPLAGETLYFKGEVLENREATEDEINHLMKHLTGGCGGHCGDCEGGCGHDHSHECCDHQHEDGCGCGHCH
jgi:FKBP-type peptidyl-prolyl cis-trans isomerase SlyD